VSTGHATSSPSRRVGRSGARELNRGGVHGLGPTRRSGKGGRLAALLAALGSSWPVAAAGSDLSWSGPADCAQSEQLMFQVERALGAPLADTGHVHLQVHVARSAPTARALLRIADDGVEPAISERRLVAPDCEKLVDTLAVAIALAIEAAAPRAETAALPVVSAPPPPAPVTLAVSNAAPPPLDATTSEPSNAALTGPSPRVMARLLGDVGSLPAPALGLGLGAQLAWSRFQVELLGALWLEQHPRLDSSTVPGAGADVSLVTGSLSACTLPLGNGGGPLAFALCAGWEMGRLSGVGTGIAGPRRASGLWAAPSIEAGLTWRPGGTRLGIGARIGAATPLGRSTFYVEQLGTVHQAASVVARGGLSLDVAL
jgi:hypothetical protein